jgi:hypothetical protein
MIWAKKSNMDFAMDRLRWMTERTKKMGQRGFSGREEDRFGWIRHKDY